MFVKWQDYIYDFEIMIWNQVSDSGKSNTPKNYFVNNSGIIIKGLFLLLVIICFFFGKFMTYLGNDLSPKARLYLKIVVLWDLYCKTAQKNVFMSLPSSHKYRVSSDNV